MIMWEGGQNQFSVPVFKQLKNVTIRILKYLRVEMEPYRSLPFPFIYKWESQAIKRALDFFVAELTTRTQNFQHVISQCALMSFMLGNQNVSVNFVMQNLELAFP